MKKLRSTEKIDSRLPYYKKARQLWFSASLVSVALERIDNERWRRPHSCRPTPFDVDESEYSLPPPSDRAWDRCSVLSAYIRAIRYPWVPWSVGREYKGKISGSSKLQSSTPWNTFHLRCCPHSDGMLRVFIQSKLWRSIRNFSAFKPFQDHLGPELESQDIRRMIRSDVHEC